MFETLNNILITPINLEAWKINADEIILYNI
jgi:hypothetical protein